MGLPLTEDEAAEARQSDSSQRPQLGKEAVTDAQSPRTGREHSQKTRERDRKFKEIPAQLQEEPKGIDRRIHMIGLGSIGRLVAHSLRDLPDPPPITLTFHTKRHLDDWTASEQVIGLETEGILVERGGFDAEHTHAGLRSHGTFVRDERWFAETDESHEVKQEDDDFDPATGWKVWDGASNEPITNLVVSLKAPITVGALLRIKHRLGPLSSILFLQNGMGVIDEVNERVFPDPKTRPQYVSGVISHGAFTVNYMKVVHTGFGTIALGVPPLQPTPGRENDTGPPRPPTLDELSPSSRYLMRTFCRSPVLSCVAVSPTELMQAQLEKLAINAVINPLTALMDCRNGGINYNYALTRAKRLLLAETALVIRALPEVKHLPTINTRFSPERLETLVVAVANKTRNNVSSMLFDVKQGLSTEIEYINGYIVRRGEQLGITCYMNYLICQLVRGKQQLVDQERKSDMPLASVPASSLPPQQLGAVEEQR